MQSNNGYNTMLCLMHIQMKAVICARIYVIVNVNTKRHNTAHTNAKSFNLIGVNGPIIW